MDRKKNIPQIRFQNYEDEWVYSTIGRHISLLNGRAYKQEELLDEGKYRVLRVGNFNTNSKWYYSNLELEDNKYVNKGDLLYLWATNFGPEIWTEEKAIYHYHIWKLEFDKTDINQDYLYIWLESDKNKIQQNTNGSTMVHITKNMMEERRISLPTQDEQSAIGSLFHTLDDLLASYKENLSNYQSLKATMLSKMFPKAGQTVPEIRLDGFEGEWEVVQLSDICQKVTEKNKDNNFNETFTNSAEFGIISQRDFFEKDISNEKSLNAYYVVRNNDFVYNPRISNYAPVGPVKRNKLGRTGVMSPLYFVFRITNSNIDLNFLETFFNTNTWHKFMKLNGDSGARADRFAIKDSTFLTMPIAFPSLPEQQAIGAYFSNLDKLINSHQEKISQLEALKKKLLQDMFI